MMAGRHIAIATWLEALNMTEYVSLFHQYGGVEDLIYATESEIKDLGIKNGAHRAKIVSSLRILREKYEKGRVTGSGVFSLQRTPSNSSSAPTSPTTPYPDYQHVIASPEKLQLDLQRELAGDPSELRSRAWYHGNISRQRAEAIVVNNGDFLVRDCISKPGDFVLTCRWKSTPLNFMINSIVGDCPPGSLPTISYQFEEDAFPTIQQLIQFYQTLMKPVTLVSGALLKNPIARSMPLSYYDSKYGALSKFVTGLYATPTQSPKPSPFVSPTGSTESSPDMKRRGVMWTGSQPILNVIDDSDDAKNNNNENTSRQRKRESRSSSLDRCDSLPVINIIPPGGIAGPDQGSGSGSSSHKPFISHTRAGSAPVLTPDNLANGNENSARKPLTLGRRKLAPASSESELSNPPPPKPSRIPSVKYKQKPVVVVRRNIQVDDDDRDYSDYSQVKEEPSWIHGDSDSAPKFRQGAPKRLSPSSPSSSAQPQVGRKGNRIVRETSRQEGDGKSQSHMSKTSVSSSPSSSPSSTPSPDSATACASDSFRWRQVPNSRKSPNIPSVNPLASHPDDPPPTQTYLIVARSRSFQASRHSDGDYDNNFGNVTDKGYKSLPRRLPKNAQGGSCLEMPKIQGSNKGSSDYDIPRQHAIDENDIFGFQDMEYMKSRRISKPPKNFASAFSPENFLSNLLPKGHKALDQSVLLNVKALLLSKTPKTLALHLTQCDLKLMSVNEGKDVGMGVTSGLELLTLPQGRQLRQDVIERWECLRLFAMVTLLSCQTVNERARVLSLWIQASMELKSTMGNLFSFAAIMSALTGPQIHALKDTWLILRQNHTASAYVFDTKLRPAYTSLNDGSSDLPLNNISIPYVTPVCYLLECQLASVLAGFYWDKGLDPVGSAIDVLLTHLDTARVIASQDKLYRVTGSALMMTLNFDPELSQALSPELHLLLLWGEKGWAAPRRERLGKLEQILTLLSQKYQAPGDDGTEV